MRNTSVQQFRIEPAHTYVIVQDDISKRYALLRPVDTWEDDFVNTFRFEPVEGQVAPQIVRFLDSFGFDVVSFRELLRQTNLQYSFIDDTSGTASDSVCIHAIVNITNRAENVVDEQKLEWHTLTEVGEAMRRSPDDVPVVLLGLAQLLTEEMILDERHRDHTGDTKK